MKIGIIGDGQVGSTTAYTLAREGIARDIVLISIHPRPRLMLWT